MLRAYLVRDQQLAAAQQREHHEAAEARGERHRRLRHRTQHVEGLRAVAAAAEHLEQAAQRRRRGQRAVLACLVEELVRLEKLLRLDAAGDERGAHPLELGEGGGGRLRRARVRVDVERVLEHVGLEACARGRRHQLRPRREGTVGICLAQLVVQRDGTHRELRRLLGVEQPLQHRRQHRDRRAAAAAAKQLVHPERVLRPFRCEERVQQREHARLGRRHRRRAALAHDLDRLLEPRLLHRLVQQPAQRGRVLIWRQPRCRRRRRRRRLLQM